MEQLLLLLVALDLEDMDEIASIIGFTLKNHEDEAKLEEAKQRVEALNEQIRIISINIIIDRTASSLGERLLI